MPEKTELPEKPGAAEAEGAVSIMWEIIRCNIVRIV
jgi:hypothetical protein